MSLSGRAVHRPVATTMVFVILTVLGGFAFTKLRVDIFPELDFPSISVVTSYSGVAPEEMETLVTRPIEAAVARVEGVDRIESFSSEGRSRVALRFAWGVDLETASNDVRAAVERVRPVIPEDVDAPVVYKFDLSNFPIAFLALQADMDEGALQRFSEDIVKPRLERITGVASADVSGARRREVRVDLDTEKLASVGLGPRDVINALTSENTTVPAGSVADGRVNVLVRALGEFKSIEDVRRARIPTGDGRTLRVRDVARVTDDFEDFVNIVRIDGERAVSLRIVKTPGANTVEVADALMAEIEAFNTDYAGKATITTVVDSSTFIRRSITGVRDSVLLGAALAFIVLLIFLRSLRSAFVIGLAIPISIIATFGLMQQFNLTLNLITFGGIALGVGMLVDNAIVILENIYRRREEGDDAKTASIEGSREVASAIVASTLTTLAVFVPVVFLGGFTAVFFRQMAIVVTSALVCSLFVALTLVPMLASFMLRGVRPGGVAALGFLARAFDALDSLYAFFVRWSLRLGVLVLAVAIISLVLALQAGEDIGQELLPEADESEIRVNAEYPVGTRIEVTEATIAELEKAVRETVPEATQIFTTVGTPGFWSTSGEENASIRVNLVPVEERARSSEEIAKELSAVLSAKAPGMRVRARAGGGLWLFRFIRGGEDRVRVEIRGFDLGTADTLAGQTVELLTAIDGISDARPSRVAGGRELRLDVDREKAADLGLSTRQVTEAISTLTQGTRAGVYREGGDEFNIRVRLERDALESMQAVLAAPLAVVAGRPLQVNDLVQVVEATTPKAIERLNQTRIVTVDGGIDGTRDLGAINGDIEDALRTLTVPNDFSVRVGGESEEQSKSFEALSMGLVLAFLLVYMVMAAQFESLLQPFVILVSVPFAAIGVVLTMLWTDTTLNLNSFLGIIVLVGVVVNNAIVLVDYINMMRRERGYALRDAIVESARRRLRPILMTTSTTILALLPVAIASGTGGEAQAPLARVVVGGMLSSTLVTLFVVPIVYLWLAQATGWVGRRLGRPEEPVRVEVTPGAS